MFRAVVGRLVTETGRVQRHAKNKPLIQRLINVSVSVRSFSHEKDKQQTFDGSLFDFLVCPLSKKPLRYDAKTNELINEELGIAYPIIDGIPNMIPQEARLIQKDSPTQD